MFSSLHGITPQKTWIFILIYVWCYIKKNWQAIAAISDNCHRWYKMRIRKRNTNFGQNSEWYLIFYFTQNGNYFTPPTLRKPLYARFVQFSKLLRYFLFTYPSVYILEVQSEVRCSNSKHLLFWNTRLILRKHKFTYFYPLLRAFAKLRKPTISFVMSVCLSVRTPAWNNSAPTVRIFMKFDTWIFFENISRKFKFN
jgi:hypothetical protein